MMEAKRIRLQDDVELTHLQTQKFKTGVLGVHLIVPLSEKTASFGALLPAVLHRGTTRYPDMKALSCELDRLYGANISCTVRKKGENQCIGFVSSFLDDSYTLGSEPLLEPMADLLSQLLLDPITKNGRFLPSYVESEKINLIDAIESIINDKRDYADMRLLQEMCAHERYGIDKLGTVSAVRKIDNQSLYRAYIDLLSTSQVEFFYCGSASLERVSAAIDSAFAALPRGIIVPPAAAQIVPAPAQPRILRETLDVTQGKLSMGFRTACTDTPAMLLCNAIFGGYSNSKLFLNVREKLSLCYFASSAYHRSKGIVTVSSGIESKNYAIARDEILAQLDAIRRSEFEPWEIESAKSCLIGSLRSREDSAGRLEEYYLGQAATGLFESSELLIEQLREVSAERISAAAQSIALDTIYFLTGKEDDHDQN